MAAQAYQGHAADSVAKAAFETPENVAPADRPDYNPADYADQPGAAARANGWPRDDAGPGGSVR